MFSLASCLLYHSHLQPNHPDDTQEEEMRRLMRAQHDGETSQSDWSEDEEVSSHSSSSPTISFQGRELLGDTDGDGVSMAANGGLTDAEGALSDVNSIYECGGGEAGDLDDTSLSSRASSRFFSLMICFCKTHFLLFRIFDSDQIYSADSLHGMYDRWCCFPSSHLQF